MKRKKHSIGRIHKKKLNYRTDSNGNQWGFKEYKIASKHQSGFLSGGFYWYKSPNGEHIEGNKAKTKEKYRQIQSLPELGKP